MLNDKLAMVQRFQEEIIGIDIPTTPMPLNKKRLTARIDHIKEELGEMVDADEEDLNEQILENQADAFVDIIYLALGGLVEMGVLPGPVFDEVHEANMKKRRGSVEKRPGADGYDAVKPEGWEPPDLTPYFAITKNDVKTYCYLSPVLREVTELRMKKANDYNSSVKLTDYFPFGHESYATMVHLKAKRLVSLVELLRHGKAAIFEGLRDTLLDIINYATFYVEWLDAKAEDRITWNQPGDRESEVAKAS